MTKLYYALYPYIMTVFITMSIIGHEFAPIPPWGIW